MLPNQNEPQHSPIPESKKPWEQVDISGLSGLVSSTPELGKLLPTDPLLKRADPAVQPRSRSDLFGANYRSGFTGNIEANLKKKRQEQSDPNYNVFEDIPLEHLTEEFIQYYITSKNKEDTNIRTLQLISEPLDNEVKSQYPWSSFVVGLVTDPVAALFPTGKAGIGLKEIYNLSGQAALKGAEFSAKFAAKQVGKAALKGAAYGAAQETLTQSLEQQIKLTKTAVDSATDIATSTVLSGGLFGLGGAFRAGVSYKGWKFAKSNLANEMGGIPDVPTMIPKSRMKPGTEIRPDGPMGPDFPLNPGGINPVKPIGGADIPGYNTIAKPLGGALDPMGMDNTPRPIGGEIKSLSSAASTLDTTLLSEQHFYDKTVPMHVNTVPPIIRATKNVNDTVARVPDWLLKKLTVSDAAKLIASPSPTANLAASLIYSKNHISNRNIHEDFTTKASLMDRIQFARQSFDFALVERNKVFVKQLGIDAESLAIPGVRARIANAMAKGEILNAQRNATELYWVLDTHDASPNASVNEQANIIKTKISDPILRKAVSVGLLDKSFLDPKNDTGYFHRMFVPSIARGRQHDGEQLINAFYRAFRDYHREGATLRQEVLDEIAKINTEIDNLREEVKKLFSYNLPKAEMAAEIDKIRKKIEALTERKSKELTDLNSSIPKEFRVDEGMPLKSLVEISDVSILASAEQTILKLMGADIGQQHSMLTTKGKASGADPFHARVLRMPGTFSAPVIGHDGKVKTVFGHEFQEKDPERVWGHYVKRMTAQIEAQSFARENGFDNIDEMRAFLSDNINKDLRHATVGLDEKAARKVSDKYLADGRRIQEAFDIALDIDKFEANVGGNQVLRTLRRIDKLNDSRNLGGCIFSMFSDPVMGAMRQGIQSFVVDSFIPTAGKVASLGGWENRSVKQNKLDAKIAGFAIRLAQDQVIQSFHNTGEYAIDNINYAKASQTAQDMLGPTSGMSQMTDFADRVLYNGVASNAARLIKRQVSGKVGKLDKAQLRAMGISPEDAIIINKQINKHGIKSMGVTAPNHNAWDLDTPEKANAYMVWNQALYYETTQSKLKAGEEDKVNWLHQNEWYRPILKYKDYLFAAQNKIVVNLTQKVGLGDINKILGATVVASAAIMSYMLGQIAKDPTKEIDLSASKLTLEAIEKGAFLGLFQLPINAAMTMWPEAFGKEPSRWASRGPWGGLAGPTLGLAGQITKDVGDLGSTVFGDRTFKDTDMLRAKKYLPFQSIFWWRYMTDEWMKAAGRQLGAEET